MFENRSLAAIPRSTRAPPLLGSSSSSSSSDLLTMVMTAIVSLQRIQGFLLKPEAKLEQVGDGGVEGMH